MGFGKLAFMCPQNRHGELSQPCSQAVRRAAAQQEGALTTGSFPPGDQAQHLPRQYTEILQKWKGGSKLLFPLQKHRKLSLLLTQIHGREDTYMGTMGSSHSYWSPREPYLLLLVTERILQSRLLESPRELWIAASWLRSSGQTQPEVGLQSPQPTNIKSQQLTNILSQRSPLTEQVFKDCS